MTKLRIAAMALGCALPLAALAADGSIEGTVDFTGKAPTPVKLHREADPYCAKKPMTDPSVLVKNGKLQNVWVHVSKGAPATLKPDASKPAEIDQKDCMYTPRMITAVVGQKILAKNTDPVLHNVHTYLGATTVFNKGMPNTKHGLQTVSGEDGSFKIDNVPPGKYTVESWHEKYGAKTQEVTVEAGKPAKATFKYDGTEKATG